MGLLVICPACFQRMDVAELDEARVAATGGVLCTCVNCKRAVRHDAERRVVVTDPYDGKLYGYPDDSSRVIARHESGDRVRFRVRGLFKWFFSKRVTVTNEHVETQLVFGMMRRSWPIAHVTGVIVVQHLFLDTMHSLWATYLAFDGGLMPLSAHSTIDIAIQHASGINRLILARKPVGDPYRGLLASGEP